MGTGGCRIGVTVMTVGGKIATPPQFIFGRTFIVTIPLPNKTTSTVRVIVATRQSVLPLLRQKTFKVCVSVVETPAGFCQPTITRFGTVARKFVVVPALKRTMGNLKPPLLTAIQTPRSKTVTPPGNIPLAPMGVTTVVVASAADRAGGLRPLRTVRVVNGTSSIRETT